MPNLNSKELLQHFQEGQSEAAFDLFEKYNVRLTALARKKIGQKLKRRFDAEDVVQSAFRSFFVHAENGEYQLNRAGDLWRLLASITMHKLHGQIDKHLAAKRSGDKELPIGEGDDFSVEQDASPSQVVSVVEELGRVYQSLSPDERMVVRARLENQDELAKGLNKSERTLRRIFASAKQKIERRLLTSEFVDSGSWFPDSKPVGLLRYSDYVLEKILGFGGMGKVYRARVKSTGSTVAIKALRKAHQTDRRAVSRFQQEGAVLANLRHSNIVGVHGMGRFPGGGFFIAMDYVDGIDLQARIDSGAVPLQEALLIVRDVARAIGHAHRVGIIHCDIKPANIMQKNDGTNLVTDFGFAFLVKSRVESLLNGIGGTKGYIAPEILKGIGNPTPASDIFSLGVLLEVLVTGRLPEAETSAGNMLATDSSIRHILSRCQSSDPRNRFQSTDELIHAIGGLGQLANS